jgi:hypothetical protein
MRLLAHNAHEVGEIDFCGEATNGAAGPEQLLDDLRLLMQFHLKRDGQARFDQGSDNNSSRAVGGGFRFLGGCDLLIGVYEPRAL